MQGLPALLGLFLCALDVQATKRNVLHIIVDDLRPEIGAYGLPNRHTPNMDKIASNGTVFTKAYCQQAVCGELFHTCDLSDSSCRHYWRASGETRQAALFAKYGAAMVSGGGERGIVHPRQYKTARPLLVTQ